MCNNSITMNETSSATGQPAASETEYLLQWTPPEEMHPAFKGIQREAYQVAFDAITRIYQIDQAAAEGNNGFGGTEWQPGTNQLERAEARSRVPLQIARHRLQTVSHFEQTHDFDQTPLSLPWLAAQGFVTLPVLAAAAGVPEKKAGQQFTEARFSSVTKYQDDEPLHYYGPDAVELTGSEMLVPHTAALEQLGIGERAFRTILEYLDLPAARQVQKGDRFSSVDDIAQVAEALLRISPAVREDITLRDLAFELKLPSTREIADYFEQSGVRLELRRLKLANRATSLLFVLPPEKVAKFRRLKEGQMQSVADIRVAAGLPTGANLRDYLTPEEKEMREIIPTTNGKKMFGGHFLPIDVAKEIIARIRSQHENCTLPEPTSLPAHLIPFSLIKSRFAYPDSGLRRIIDPVFETQICSIAGEQTLCYPWEVLRHLALEIEGRTGEVLIDHDRLPASEDATPEQEKYARSIQVQHLEALRPPAFMLSLAEITDEIKISVNEACSFLRDYGGEVRAYFTADGEEQLYTTKLGAQLLKRQWQPVRIRALPEGWLRRDEIARSTQQPIALFDRWLNEHPEFLDRAEWRKRQDIKNPPNLPYFAPAVIAQFVADVTKGQA